MHFYEWQIEYSCRIVKRVNWVPKPLLLLGMKECCHLLVLKFIILLLKSVCDHSTSLLISLELGGRVCYLRSISTGNMYICVCVCTTYVVDFNSCPSQHRKALTV